uniref:Ig-like domain-containing protein n=1 Tax=Sparus aurata TaxID=8175 RepID=A0A671XXP5_SPAAU
MKSQSDCPEIVSSHFNLTKTVGVGQNVTLTCDRQKSWRQTYLYWIRLVPGTFPEDLAGTLAYDLEDYVETHHITAKLEPGKLILHILETQLSDTAIYYCITVSKFKMTFLKGTFLRIKGPEPDVTAITQDPLSDPVRPGDSVTLQCSVLSDSQNKPCPGGHSVFWFRAGSEESNPSFIYSHGNSSAKCETSLEARSPQKCVYSFSKNFSSSDAGTYNCAVATCGEILFGNGTKLDVEVIGTCDSDNITVLLLCAAVAVSLIVIGVLVYAFRKKSCDCCNGKRHYAFIDLLKEMRTLWFILQQLLPRGNPENQEEDVQERRRSTVMSGLL